LFILNCLPRRGWSWFPPPLFYPPFGPVKWVPPSVFGPPLSGSCVFVLFLAQTPSIRGGVFVWSFFSPPPVYFGGRLPPPLKNFGFDVLIVYFLSSGTFVSPRTDERTPCFCFPQFSSGPDFMPLFGAALRPRSGFLHFVSNFIRQSGVFFFRSFFPGLHPPGFFWNLALNIPRFEASLYVVVPPPKPKLIRPD